MASAIAVMVRSTLKSEFRRIDPTAARILLVDMSPRVLGTFPEELSKHAQDRLKALDVEVLLGHSSAGHSDFCVCHTLHLPHRPRSEVSTATFFVFQKSPRARRRRGVPRVCAAYRARWLHVSPEPDKKYGEGAG